MSVAMLCFFVVFIATLVGRVEREPALALPVAEAYHDENVGFTRDFTPWVVAAVILLLIAYGPPLYEIVTGPVQAVPGYAPSSPVATGP
jgi:ABC-type amino acid transport system permease subunit